MGGPTKQLSATTNVLVCWWAIMQPVLRAICLVTNGRKWLLLDPGLLQLCMGV